MTDDALEQRLARIERALTGLEIAVATAVAGLVTKADLANFATKTDLEAGFAGIAKNVATSSHSLVGGIGRPEIAEGYKQPALRFKLPPQGPLFHSPVCEKA